MAITQGRRNSVLMWQCLFLTTTPLLPVDDLAAVEAIGLAAVLLTEGANETVFPFGAGDARVEGDVETLGRFLYRG